MTNEGTGRAAITLGDSCLQQLEDGAEEAARWRRRASAGSLGEAMRFTDLCLLPGSTGGAMQMLGEVAPTNMKTTVRVGWLWATSLADSWRRTAEERDSRSIKLINPVRMLFLAM